MRRKKRKRERDTFEYIVHQTDKGVGLECPKPHCGGRMIVDIELLRETRRELGQKMVMCPYCECLSRVPKGEV